jgi:hypothetical protein
MSSISDWNTLPKDLYVVSAETPDGVVIDVRMCSVPMVVAPEVRYIQASSITALRAALEKIEGGHLPNAAELALSGNWTEIATQFQAIARKALEDSK